jgi:anthranilate synthase component 1
VLTQEQFESFAREGYNRVPVSRAVMADLDTPLSTYLKLANGPDSYLLESVQGGEKWGRYSIIGLPCSIRMVVKGQKFTVTTGNRVTEEITAEDPLACVEAFLARFRVPDIAGLPRFSGGLVGYFGYDTVRYIETRLQTTTPPDMLDTPDIYLMLSEELVIFDNLSGRLILIHHADPHADGAYLQAQKRLDLLENQLRKPLPEHNLHVGEALSAEEQDFTSGFGREAFESAVHQIKDYVLAGDVMQTVLSQRMSLPFRAAPINLYRSLRCLNPSPYMYFLQLQDFHVVGSSPEILTRLEDGEVTVRPIAGTRPRGQNSEQDKAFEKDLLADPKELAEHLMLIDLGRNDVGRVSVTGSVKVSEQMVIERYSHVMHIVSNVTGKLQEGLNAMDVLRATLPAGTLSGAPKVRAMEIIDELEPVKRGVYGGAVGYLAWNGTMDTAIAIRTAIIKDQMLYVQAGAGIVADSVPRSEWEETLNKGRAIFRAVAMAQKGL